MVQPSSDRPKRVFVPTNEAGEGERPKRQNSGDLRPRSRRLSSEEEEYTTDETSDEEEEEPVRLASSGKSSKPPRRWQPSEDRRLAESVEQHGEANWKAIAARVGSRNHVQCLQRWKKVLRPGLVKGQWSAEEDVVLMKLATSGYKNWGVLSNHMPGRTSKQCRERWCHHLDPSINKGAYSPEEDKIIVETQARLGNKWSQIAARLPGRTENSIKIRCKALQRKGSGSGNSNGNGGQTLPSSPRASRKSSSASASRSRASSAGSASSGVSASSCASAADCFVDSFADSFADNFADSFADRPPSDADEAPPEYHASSPRTSECSSALVAPKIELGITPLSSSSSMRLSASTGTALSTRQSPFFQTRRSGKGKELRLNAGSFAASGDDAAQTPFSAVAPPSRAPPSIPMSTGDPAIQGWWWPWPRTSALENPAGTSTPLSAPPWPVSASAGAVKQEVLQQAATPSGSFMNYSPVEPSTAGDTGGAAFDGPAVPTTGLPRSPVCAGAVAAPPLSHWFEYGLNTIVAQGGAGMEGSHVCVTQPPSSSERPSFGSGLMPSAPPAESTLCESAVAGGKDEGEAVFGDFNALGVEDLKVAVGGGGDDDDDAAAPLRSCCSFLDLPAEGMVVGDMPLSW